jgi:hypothetical protein
MNVWTDLAASEKEPVASACECDNELFVSIIGEESLRQLSDYHVLGNDSTTIKLLISFECRIYSITVVLV